MHANGPEALGSLQRRSAHRDHRVYRARCRGAKRRLGRGVLYECRPAQSGKRAVCLHRCQSPAIGYGPDRDTSRFLSFRRYRSRRIVPQHSFRAGGAAMYLVQILLPLADNEGKAFSEPTLQGIRTELFERFGGLTAYLRAPALGAWAKDGTEKSDDIAIVEVMAQTLDEAWWSSFRARLEAMLHQDEVVIRAQEIQKL